MGVSWVFGWVCSLLLLPFCGLRASNLLLVVMEFCFVLSSFFWCSSLFFVLSTDCHSCTGSCVSLSLHSSNSRSSSLSDCVVTIACFVSCRGVAGGMCIVHLLEICLLVVEGWILSIVCLV